MNFALPPRPTVSPSVVVTLVAAAVTLTATLLAGGGSGGDGGAGARTAAAGRNSAHGGERAASPVPYVRLSAGDCFDHPGLSGATERTERRPCAEPHDAEVVGHRKLKGTFRSDEQLGKRALALCAGSTEHRLKRIPQDGRGYRTYAVHPSLDTYRQHRGAPVACALTLGGERPAAGRGDPAKGGPGAAGSTSGPKLTAPLP